MKPKVEKKKRPAPGTDIKLGSGYAEKARKKLKGRAAQLEDQLRKYGA